MTRDSTTDFEGAPVVPLLRGDEPTDRAEWRPNPLEYDLQADAE